LGIASESAVRDMEQDDLDTVMEIENEIFDSPWTRDLFDFELSRPEKTMYLVAEHEGKVVGYLGAQLLYNEIHVTNMAVTGRARRMGVGSLLLISCIRCSVEKGGRWLTLEVRESNNEARAFYELFGFDPIGIRHGYYSDIGEDAVIMVTGDIRDRVFLELLDELELSRVHRKGVR